MSVGSVWEKSCNTASIKIKKKCPDVKAEFIASCLNTQLGTNKSNTQYVGELRIVHRVILTET